MPRSKNTKRQDVRIEEKKVWMAYSTNREYCFHEEIRAGFFGPNTRCGCTSCDPQLVLPTPAFTQEPAQGH